jgi:formamidopyrimidine-DNA glycosylase
MPELPTVEIFRQYLIKKDIRDVQIEKVHLFWERSVLSPTPESFVQSVEGTKITEISRRGKWIVIHLSEGILGIHLRMTGSLEVLSHSEGLKPYARTIFELNDGRKLIFIDPRKFGKVWFGLNTDKLFSNLGPEPLGPTLLSKEEFQFDYFENVVKKRNVFVKTLLLDQSVVVGIGNIYADEILLEATISPFARTNDLLKGEILDLYNAILNVMANAIKALGTLLNKGFLPIGTEESREHFALPRFRDSRCQKCSTVTQKTVINGRGTYYCFMCQNSRSEKI